MNPAVTLIAFDFDGTIAKICEDPAEARIDRSAAALLHELANVPGVVVAVASGRDAEDLAERTKVPGVYIIGSHGLEIRAPGGEVVRDTPPLSVLPDNQFREQAQRAGLRLETKKHGVALHWRGIDLDASSPTLASFRAWAESNELHLIEGRCVIEARIRGGTKEDALRWLSLATGASRVIYAGDDVTDFGALRLAAESGHAVFLANPERDAPPNTTVVFTPRELLRVIRRAVSI